MMTRRREKSRICPHDIIPKIETVLDTIIPKIETVLECTNFDFLALIPEGELLESRAQDQPCSATVRPWRRPS